MARMKKKRRTKHRGNAAGVVEARGRTGRKPRPDERTNKQDARQRRLERLDTPPTWRGAMNRAAVAAIFFFVLLVLFFRDQPFAGKVFIAAFMLIVYVPMGYYTDLFVYRRRQAKRLQQRAAAKQEKDRT